jgi:hypothetical protein
VRWFFINIPVCIVALLWGRRVSKVKGHNAKLDVPGAVSAFIFLFSILLSVDCFRIRV